jgi:hypothetical protein
MTGQFAIYFLPSHKVRIPLHRIRFAVHKEAGDSGDESIQGSTKLVHIDRAGITESDPLFSVWAAVICHNWTDSDTDMMTWFDVSNGSLDTSE